MAELQRYKECGCVVAEDLGRYNSQFSYVGTKEVKSPYGKARNFGNNQQVTIPFRPDLNVTDITIIARVRNNTASVRNVVVSRGDFTDGYGRYNLCTDFANNRLVFFDGGLGYLASAEVFDDLGKWVTIAMTINGSSRAVNFYRNGVPAGSVTATVNGVPGTNTEDIIIGRRGDGLFSFLGDMKEVIIDKRVWSAKEIKNYHENKVFDYDKNIISRWNLDATDTIKDLGWKKLGYDGTVNGTPTLDDNPFGSKCLNFDGTDDNVDLGTITQAELVPNQDVSVSLWIKPGLTSSNLAVYDQRNTGIKGFFIGINSTNNIYTFFYRNSTTANPQLTTLNTYTNTWTHVAVSINRDGLMSLYINGELNSSGSVAASSALDLSINTSIVIGQKSYEGSGLLNFIGCISKPIIFNSALTSIQVRDIYNRTRRNEL